MRPGWLLRWCIGERRTDRAGTTHLSIPRRYRHIAADSFAIRRQPVHRLSQDYDELHALFAVCVRHAPVMRQQRANKLRRNNKTGIVGVTCVLGPDGQPLQWSAHTYIAPGQLLQKTFSVYRYGDDA